MAIKNTDFWFDLGERGSKLARVLKQMPPELLTQITTTRFGNGKIGFKWLQDLFRGHWQDRQQLRSYLKNFVEMQGNDVSKVPAIEAYLFSKLPQRDIEAEDAARRSYQDEAEERYRAQRDADPALRLDLGERGNKLFRALKQMPEELREQITTTKFGDGRIRPSNLMDLLGPFRGFKDKSDLEETIRDFVDFQGRDGSKARAIADYLVAKLTPRTPREGWPRVSSGLRAAARQVRGAVRKMPSHSVVEELAKRCSAVLVELDQIAGLADDHGSDVLGDASVERFVSLVEAARASVKRSIDAL